MKEFAGRLDELESTQKETLAKISAASTKIEPVKDPLREPASLAPAQPQNPEVISELFAANDVLRDEIHDLNNKLVKIQQQCEEAAKKATEADEHATKAEQMAGGCKCSIM